MSYLDLAPVVIKMSTVSVLDSTICSFIKICNKVVVVVSPVYLSGVPIAPIGNQRFFKAKCCITLTELGPNLLLNDFMH